MGILEGKKILVTGVITDASIAFAAARLAQEQGATVVLSNFGRALSLCQRIAKRLPQEAAGRRARRHQHRAPGHAGRPGARALRRPRRRRALDRLRPAGGAWASGFPEAPGSTWRPRSRSRPGPTRRWRRPAGRCWPTRRSVVGLTFDATVAWPVYDWMGVAKAGAGVGQPLPGPRPRPARASAVNLVAAGPLRTMATKSIPGFDQFEEAWEGRAPLGWSVTDTEPAGKAVVALLSDWFPATTGEIVHVDGGFHAVGV